MVNLLFESKFNQKCSFLFDKPFFGDLKKTEYCIYKIAYENKNTHTETIREPIGWWVAVGCSMVEYRR